MADLRRSTRAAVTKVKSMQEAESSDEEANESGGELGFGAEVGGKGQRASKGGTKTPAKAATPSTAAPGTSKHKPPPHPNTAKATNKKQRVGETPVNKATAAKGRKADVSGLDGVPLLDVVKERAGAIPSAVGQFVGRYERSPQAAIAEWQTFLVQACGSSLTIPEEDLMDETDVDDVVKDIIASAQEGHVENLLFSKDKKLKHFRQNLLDFWDLLILECQSNILFDEKLFDKCIGYIIAISCTPVRTFRQVGTLIGLQLVSSLVTVAKSCTDLRETTQRQLQAEKRKKDASRVADLNKTLEDMHAKTTATEELMRKLFTGVFMHRYRDIDEFVRANCVEALGSWILEYPSMFLKDLYTKYLGWMLNDTDAHVRQTAVIALRNLYEVEDNIASLELFTQRFSGRMLELAEDVDEHVAVEAVKLIKELLRNELLSDQDTSRLYELLVDESAQMRHAVGDLVHDQLVSNTLVQGSTPTGKSAKESKSPEGQLKRVLAMLAEFSGNRALCSYVVDALWESTKVLQDWKTITKVLLTERAKDDLPESDATNLVRLLNASVKKVHGEKLVKDTDGKAVHVTKAQREATEKKEEELTVAMMKALPQLLRKYQADKAKVMDLVEVTAYLKLELYSLKRQEPTFISMLQLVKEIFFKHADTGTLNACVRAIKYSVREGKAELQDGAQQVLTELESEIVKKVKAAVKKAKKSESESEEYALTVALARAQALYAEQKPQDETVYQNVVELLEEVDGLDDEVVRLALRLIFLQVAWSLGSLNKDTPSEDSLTHVVALRDRLMELAELALDNALELWSEESLQSKLAAEVCDILADTWAIFSHTKLKDTSLERLGYSPPDSLVRKFWELTEKRLDAAAEDIDEDEEQAHDPQGDDSLKHEVLLPAAKLVKWSLVQKDFLAPELVSNFVLHGRPTAEVIKSMSGRSEDQWKTYLEALKRAFKRYLDATTEDDDYLSEGTYKEFKDLAHRISSVYASFAKAQLRPVILKIVKGGMEYAFSNAPRTLPFLEGAIVQFAVKLEPADMRALIAEANERAGDVDKEENPHAWRPFNNFVETLEAKTSGHAGVKGAATKGRKKAKDGRKLEFDEEESGEDASGAEPTTPGDQTEQEDEETQPLRDPRKERRSAGAAQYQRKSAKKTPPVEETLEEDEESVRRRKEKGKAKEVEETQDEIEEEEPSTKLDEDDDEDEVAGSGGIGSYNATEEQLPARRKVERPQMKPLFASEETEEAENSELPSQEQDAEDEELLAINVNGKRKAPTQASQSPLAASASIGGSEEAEPVAYKRSRKT